MNQEITYEHDGITIKAEYAIYGDILEVYLPDGETKTTVLSGGLKAKTAIVPHLISYAKKVAEQQK